MVARHYAIVSQQGERYGVRHSPQASSKEDFAELQLVEATYLRTFKLSNDDEVFARQFRIIEERCHQAEQERMPSKTLLENITKALREIRKRK